MLFQTNLDSCRQNPAVLRVELVDNENQWLRFELIDRLLCHLSLYSTSQNENIEENVAAASDNRFSSQTKL